MLLRGSGHRESVESPRPKGDTYTEMVTLFLQRPPNLATLIHRIPRSNLAVCPRLLKRVLRTVAEKLAGMQGRSTTPEEWQQCGNR